MTQAVQSQWVRPGYLYFGHGKGDFAPCGDHKLYYEVHGDGEEKILLIPPLAATHTVWEAQFSRLGEEGTGLSVCAYDARGIGFSQLKSPPPSGRWTTSALAKDALLLLDHLGWRTCHVVGLSMGGMVAQELTLLAPQRVRSLTLISTFAGGLGSAPPLTGLARLMQIVQGVKAKGEAARVGVKLMFSPGWCVQRAEGEPRAPSGGAAREGETNEDRAVRSFVTRGRMYKEVDGAQELAISTIARQMGAIASHYVSHRRLGHLRKAGIPVLVVTGGQDNLVRPRNGFGLASALDAEHVHIPGAGHNVNEECHEQVNTSIQRHISRAAASASTPTSAAPYPPHMHPWPVAAAAGAAIYLLAEGIRWVGVTLVGVAVTATLL
eukprot:Hpha_TRINITY_DN15613_c1_g3::TRINITY_DN15613_c1_g3_i1::g.100126::m.100126